MNLKLFCITGGNVLRKDVDVSVLGELPPKTDAALYVPVKHSISSENVRLVQLRDPDMRPIWFDECDRELFYLLPLPEAPKEIFFEGGTYNWDGEDLWSPLAQTRGSMRGQALRVFRGGKRRKKT